MRLYFRCKTSATNLLKATKYDRALAYIFAAAILCGLVILVARYFSLWLQAFFTGTGIGLVDLLLMSLRKANPSVIVPLQGYGGSIWPGATVEPGAIEAHYLAGGDVHRVTLALIAANRAGIALDWNTAAAIDLSGRDVMEAVRVSVNPKVINCPDPKEGQGDTLNGVAKDGIQLKVRVRVTVRTNLCSLLAVQRNLQWSPASDRVSSLQLAHATAISMPSVIP